MLAQNQFHLLDCSSVLYNVWVLCGHLVMQPTYVQLSSQAWTLPRLLGCLNIWYYFQFSYCNLQKVFKVLQIRQMFSNVLKQVLGVGGKLKRLVLGTIKSIFGQTVAQEENNLRMSKFPFHICGSCKAQDFLAGAGACCCFRLVSFPCLIMYYLT